ncbi:MAG TPA: hypothetical protein VFS79_07200 [Arthrobacter sp.]|nr:hypothetical protein [Arthrobacter sp.]
MIRQWAEERDGVPATVEGTEHGDHLGVLRMDFGGENGKLRHISWEERFETFASRGLNFIYQEQRSDGQQSNFFRLENPGREDARAAYRPAASPAPAHKAGAAPLTADTELTGTTMRELIPSGSLRGMLLPPTYGQHVTRSTEFTVLSVEIWSAGLVVNIHLASDDAKEPRIVLQDHFGTEYSFRDSATLGSRNLQVFTPTVPPGTRSLTVRAADDPEGRPVVTFAVPLMAVPEEPGSTQDDEYPSAPELRRPA